jgi:hypothetical protein
MMTNSAVYPEAHAGTKSTVSNRLHHASTIILPHCMLHTPSLNAMPTVYCAHPGCRCSSFISAHLHGKCGNCQHNKIGHPEYPLTEDTDYHTAGTQPVAEDVISETPNPGSGNVPGEGVAAEVSDNDDPNAATPEMDVAHSPRNIGNRPYSQVATTPGGGVVVAGRRQPPVEVQDDGLRYEGWHQRPAAADIPCRLVVVDGRLECLETRAHIPEDLSVPHVVARTVVYVRHTPMPDGSLICMFSLVGSLTSIRQFRQ